MVLKWETKKKKVLTKTKIPESFTVIDPKELCFSFPWF